MKKKKTEEPFILFYFKEDALEILKFKRDAAKPIELCAYCSEPYPDINDKQFVSQKLKLCLSRLGYNNERAVLVIGHQKVSSRCLSLPSRDPQEIEEMLRLQVVKMLPFPGQEIIYGYQIVHADAKGGSFVNVSLVHRDTVTYFLDILRENGIEIRFAYLSAYGVVGLFQTLFPQAEERQEVLLINATAAATEIMVCKDSSLCLSRYVKVLSQKEPWEEEFFKQVMDTQSLYLRQAELGPIKRVFVIGPAQVRRLLHQALDERLSIPVEECVIEEGSLQTIRRAVAIPGFPESVAALLGFCLKFPAESLDLLPPELMEKRKRLQLAQQRVKIIFIAALSVCVIALGLWKQRDNKRRFLLNLDNELQRLSVQAKDLEQMADALDALQMANAAHRKIIEFFYAVHLAAPPGILLETVQYDSKADEKFSLEGTSKELGLVFDYAANLQKEARLDHEIKVQYATQRKAEGTDAVTFKIVFLKKQKR